MFLIRFVRFLRARLRAIADYWALRVLMLIEHEPSNDRVELLVDPAPHETIRVCLPKDQVRMQLRVPVLRSTASIEGTHIY